ncbi:MAG: hypothetical protein HW389_3243 [Bacteroidetes bacterium]|nr:hypothetical protein [Bacteroidota bacterium]
MRLVSPKKVLEQVAAAVPVQCQANIIVAGSLAAGFLLLKDEASYSVRTKDIDCLLSPRIKAVESGRAVVKALLDAGWVPRDEGEHTKPGTASTPDDQLPGIWLYPPGHKDWFIELLSVPSLGQGPGGQWTRIELPSGHFGLPSFRFLSLLEFWPVKTEFGIYCARTEMMVLANLLEHPRIKPDLMSGLIENRRIKRSNKDLGRVLATAVLASPEKAETWAHTWEEALHSCFPNEWATLAASVGSGLRELLQSGNDVEEALHTCNYGLLVSMPKSIEEITVIGQRVLRDAIEPLEEKGRGSS